MDREIFVRQLAKMLEEEIALSFTVNSKITDNNIEWFILVDLLDSVQGLILFPYTKIIISLSDNLESLNVSLFINNSKVVQFHNIQEPGHIVESILEILFNSFSRELTLMEHEDFLYSVELKSYLERNKYLFSFLEREKPYLTYYKHTDNLCTTYVVDFIPDKKKGVLNLEMGKVLNNTEKQVLYKTELNNKNRESVFSNILSLLAE